MLGQTLLWGGFDPPGPKGAKYDAQKEQGNGATEKKRTEGGTEQAAPCKLAARKGLFALIYAIAFSILHTFFIWNRAAWLKVLAGVCCLVATCYFAAKIKSGSTDKAPVKGAGEDDIEAGEASQSLMEQAAKKIQEGWCKRPLKAKPRSCFSRQCLF